ADQLELIRSLSPFEEGTNGVAGISQATRSLRSRLTSRSLVSGRLIDLLQLVPEALRRGSVEEDGLRHADGLVVAVFDRQEPRNRSRLRIGEVQEHGGRVDLPLVVEGEEKLGNRIEVLSRERLGQLVDGAPEVPKALHDLLTRGGEVEILQDEPLAAGFEAGVSAEDVGESLDFHSLHKSPPELASGGDCAQSSPFQDACSSSCMAP